MGLVLSMHDLVAPSVRRWSIPREAADLRLFSASATIMLLELICIRWIPSYLTLFGFFINFVLLGALLGIGAGLLCGAQRKFPAFPLMLFGLIYFIWLVHDGFGPSTTEILFYGAEAKHRSAIGFLILPGVFGFVAALFMPLGQILAEGFDLLKPMRAYFLDITGSLFGIALFALMSWFSTPPVVWIMVLAPLAMALVTRPQRLVSAASLLAVGCMMVFMSGQRHLVSLLPDPLPAGKEHPRLRHLGQQHPPPAHRPHQGPPDLLLRALRHRRRRGLSQRPHHRCWNRQRHRRRPQPRRAARGTPSKSTRRSTAWASAFTRSTPTTTQGSPCISTTAAPFSGTATSTTT